MYKYILHSLSENNQFYYINTYKKQVLIIILYLKYYNLHTSDSKNCNITKILINIKTRCFTVKLNI